MDQSDSGFYGNEIPFISSSFEKITLLHDSNQGYCRLYKAQRMGKWFVLKCLKKEYAENPLYRNLLRKEFDIGYQLSHPHIIQTMGFETISPYGACIVLEYVDGITLREYIEGHNHSFQETARWVDELCQALSYIHTKQIVHRDLKPENILITANGHHVKLIDFGFSDADSYAILKEPAGTHRYAAPEQMKRGEKVDGRADIYALGILLEELVNKDKSILAIARKCCRSEVSKRPSEAASIPALIKKHRLECRIKKILIVGLLFLILLAGYYNYRTSDASHLTEVSIEVESEDSVVSIMPSRDVTITEDKIVVKEKNKEKRSEITDAPALLTIDNVFKKQQRLEEPLGAYQHRWLLKDYVDAEMDKVLIPWLFHVYKITEKGELQTFLSQEKDKGELFLRLQQKVNAGYVAFIQSHPLAEIDAEKYRPLMQYYVAEHYEEVRQFYRPMFDDKEREWQGLAMSNHSVHERLNHALRGIILSRLHPHLHHCDTMQHHASLRPITMEEWKTEIKSDAQNWLMSELSTNDPFYTPCLSIVESTIENVHKELHGGRIRLAEKDARFRFE